MQQRSYAEQIKNSEKILAGVKNHKGELIEKGYTTETFITGYEKRLRDTIELKNTQEKMKVELVRTTAKLNLNLDDLRMDRQTIKGIVKSYIDKTKWKSFGITDGRRRPVQAFESDYDLDDTNVDI